MIKNCINITYIKVLLLILYVLIPLVVFSQIVAPIETDALEMARQEHEAKYDKLEPPTGLLIDRAITAPISNIAKYTGTTEQIIPATRKDLDKVLYDLQGAGLSTQYKFYNSYYQRDEYEAYHIDLIFFDYNKVSDEIIKDHLYKEDEYGAYEIDVDKYPDAYGNKWVFISSIDRRKIYDGNQAKFRINSQNIITSQDLSATTVRVDFADGSNFRDVQLDTDISVSYLEEGLKTITIEIIHNQTVFKSAFTVDVKDFVLPPHHSFWLDEEETTVVRYDPYDGVPEEETVMHVKGLITHFPPNSAGDPESALYDVENPIIFVEGFDPFGTNTGRVLYVEKFLKTGLGECLLNNGYDIFILDFAHTNKKSIQSNADLLIKLIEDINTKYKITKNANVVIGVSMGGLVGKYALGYMEKYNISHETSLFVTIDTPHRGANIPLGAQETVEWLSWYSIPEDITNTIKWARREVLNSMAAKQMLIHHYQHDRMASNNKDIGMHRERELFLEDFKNIGFPQKCRTVAISNGNPNGIGQPFKHSEIMVDVKFELDCIILGIDVGDCPIKTKIWAAPGPYSYSWSHLVGTVDGPGRFEYNALVSYYEYTTATNDPKPYKNISYDHAPGGQLSIDLSKFIAPDELKIYTLEESICFVPTISSLDLDVTDPFYDVRADDDILLKTPFDILYYASKDVLDLSDTKNQEHLEITAETIDWLTDELTRANLVLDGNTWNYGEKKATESIRLLPGYHSNDTHLYIAPALDCNK